MFIADPESVRNFLERVRNMHPKQNEHCAYVHSSIFLFNNSHEPTVYEDQWLGDQQPMSCKGRKRNRFFPHRMYCPGICPETEKKSHKTFSHGSWCPDQEMQQGISWMQVRSVIRFSQISRYFELVMSRVWTQTLICSFYFIRNVHNPGKCNWTKNIHISLSTIIETDLASHTANHQI